MDIWGEQKYIYWNHFCTVAGDDGVGGNLVSRTLDEWGSMERTMHGSLCGSGHPLVFMFPAANNCIVGLRQRQIDFLEIDIHRWL